jgi:CheY-like chemotaxis protein
LAIYVARNAHTLPWPGHASPRHYPAPHVLLIEGHTDTRELYELWLSQRAFAVTAAASGAEALVAARGCAPDLVIVELMVADGGLPLVRALRAEPGCRDTVIVVLTTQAGPVLQQRALEAGADFYLVKPCGILRLGEVMAIASRHRFRLVTPDPDAPRSMTRLRQAVRRFRAIGERLAGDSPAPPASPGLPRPGLPGPGLH